MKTDDKAGEHTVAQACEAAKQAEDRQRGARARLATGAAVPIVKPQIAAAKATRAAALLARHRTDVRAPAG